jgi:hypothetical protein
LYENDLYSAINQMKKFWSRKILIENIYMFWMFYEKIPTFSQLFAITLNALKFENMLWNDRK